MSADAPDVKMSVEGKDDQNYLLLESAEWSPSSLEWANTGPHPVPLGAAKEALWGLDPLASPPIHAADDQVPASQLVMGGLTGALVGTAAGVGVSWLYFRDRFDVQALGHGLITVASAQAVGLALGVHVADERDGSFWIRAGTSLGLAVAGLVVSDQAWGPAFALVPPLQLYTLAGLRIGNRF